MANIRKYTNSSFIEYGQLPSSNVPSQVYSVLGSTAFDRRIYGIGITLNDASSHTSTRFFINDGTKNFQLNLNSITAQSGFSTSQAIYDLFGASTISPYFSKNYDRIGVPYFNLPAGWSFGASSALSLGAGQNMGFWYIGEYYGSNSLIYASNEYTTTASFVLADSTNVKTIIPSAIYDRRIYSISALNSDSTARPIVLKLNDGTTSRTIVTISILANSGTTTAILPVDIFAHPNSNALFNKQRDASDEPFFHLPAGWSIQANLSSAVAGTSAVKITIKGETYE